MSFENNLDKLTPELAKWLEITVKKSEEYLAEQYKDKNDDGKYICILEIGDDVLTKEDWDKPTILLSELRGEVTMKKYEDEIYEIYGNTYTELHDEIFLKAPKRGRILSECRRLGISVREIFLSITYSRLAVYVNIEGLAERSGIKQIDDIEIRNGKVLYKEGFGN